MSPNPFGLLKLAVRPDKWTQRTPAKSPRRQEQWKSPFPGTYEYRPGRGWYLVAFDAEFDEASLPVEVLDQKPTRLPCAITYSKLLRRHMFADEYNVRRRFERVKDSSGKLSTLGFFRLDDGVTFVQCWDVNGTFHEGPYFRYYLDEVSNTMRRMYPDTAQSTERVERQSRRDRWERTQSLSVAKTNVSEPCSSCGSTRVGSFSGGHSRQSSTSTVGESSAVGTAITTPSAGPSMEHTTEFSAAELRRKLMQELDRR